MLNTSLKARRRPLEAELTVLFDTSNGLVSVHALLLSASTVQVVRLSHVLWQGYSGTKREDVAVRGLSRCSISMDGQVGEAQLAGGWIARCFQNLVCRKPVSDTPFIIIPLQCSQHEAEANCPTLEKRDPTEIRHVYCMDDTMYW